jgi:hypothetical protein
MKIKVETIEKMREVECIHYWIIDSSGRGVYKLCHETKQFPEPDNRQIFLYSNRYGGQKRQEYYKGGILA